MDEDQHAQLLRRGPERAQRFRHGSRVPLTLVLISMPRRSSSLTQRAHLLDRQLRRPAAGTVPMPTSRSGCWATASAMPSLTAARGLAPGLGIGEVEVLARARARSPARRCRAGPCRRGACRACSSVRPIAANCARLTSIVFGLVKSLMPGGGPGYLACTMASAAGMPRWQWMSTTRCLPRAPTGIGRRSPQVVDLAAHAATFAGATVPLHGPKPIGHVAIGDCAGRARSSVSPSSSITRCRSVGQRQRLLPERVISTRHARASSAAPGYGAGGDQVADFERRAARGLVRDHLRQRPEQLGDVGADDRRPGPRRCRFRPSARC